MEGLNITQFAKLVTSTKPYGVSFLNGGLKHPHLDGVVRFYEAGQGTMVVAEVVGLPRPVATKMSGATGSGPFFAFHIHEGNLCAPDDGADPFSAAGGHYNPKDVEHPYHAGDMPPLMADNGYAYMSFYTDRFRPSDIVGKTVIIHQNADDFHTQPSGAAGARIACGVIERVAR